MNQEAVSPYEMTLSLNVLEHLGINLYSNVPSVLSEVVANAWDADADEVHITFDRAAGRIEIRDTGIGMTQEEVNERFLRVGYQRRVDQEPLTPERNRAPMGRKGIGKLSLFSIAGTVEVYTVKNGGKSALQMKLNDIREAIKNKNQGIYRPPELSIDGIDFTKGTKIVLSDLRRQQTISTAKALRKRIARRFSIIGAKQDFDVFVNEEQITPADRDYHSKLQYTWTYDNQEDVVALATTLSRDSEDRTAIVEAKGIRVSGWLGTVHESGQLKDEESGDNLNRIAIFVRGKMAQEDILDDFSERGVYASYLIGELRVDILDEDDQEDAATSSRQHLVEDDPRYIKLKEVLGDELKHIQNKWSEWRTDDGAKKALEIPELTDWVDKLPSGQKKNAKSWLGRIYRLRTNDQEERKQLLKHAVFAFEFHRANENLGALDRIHDENLDSVLEIFSELDSLESNLYGQIVQQRVAVIRTLQEKVDADNREQVIQRFLYEHLWLLDPHWERVEASELMEARIDKLFSEVDAQLTKEEKAGRLDIKYRKSAGTHIIIELKRPSRVVDIAETTKQLEKYYSGFTKLLEKQGVDEPLEMVLVLGKPPREWANPKGQERFRGVLDNYNARLVFYDELLENAFRSYKDYLDQKQAVDRLQAIIQAIENYTA